MRDYIITVITATLAALVLEHAAPAGPPPMPGPVPGPMAAGSR